MTGPGPREVAGSAAGESPAVPGHPGGTCITPAVPGHPGGTCITCSDTAVTVTVLRLLADGLAVVAAGLGDEEVSVALVTAQPGDRILVHAGEAIGIVGR